MKKLLLACVTSFVLITSASAIERDDIIMALQDYMEMAAFGDGVIMAANLAEIKDEVVLVDARQAQDFSNNAIPGAINIDWRFVLSELDKLPEDKMIVLYCDTGILSSKAHMALRLVGYDQVRVLFNGLAGWQQHHGQ
ncbi:rhodanese-like domain-containing protein [Thiomicrospira sp. R3]|uniref:rhodanese-like domain-containing protein n=1 Tax=Thiomicrospira sp. R3 TaxID=3035472 RepID=UPI00259B1498|nr:rhodanese-like domain-containing protein [Thiomicrospira sp. R3]WFE67905.1 rhodanese-like domain-containing protein [Thiomicrospira sp. R3]